MTIFEASRELFKELRKYDEVISTEVKSGSNGNSFIIVKLEKITKSIIGNIPKIYQGNKVKTEIDKPYYSYSNR